MLKTESKKITVFYEDNIIDFFTDVSRKQLKESINGLENVLFFSKDRKLMINPEIVEADKLFTIMSKQTTLISTLEYAFDISDSFVLNNKKIGDELENGYMQLVNFLYSIHLSSNKNLIVAIEFPETSLHELARAHLIQFIASMEKVKKLYVATQSESIYKMVDTLKDSIHKDRY